MNAVDEIKMLIDKLASGDIPPDEPLFTLRARDATAPGAVVAWAQVAHAAGASDKKVNAAMELAATMRHWPTKQVPGRPETRTHKGVPS